MNKDKIIEKIDNAKDKSYYMEFNTDTRKAYQRGLNKAKEFIQSEPEETKPIEIEGVKTNTTYTKGKVAELILEYALDLERNNNSANNMNLSDVVFWLNERLISKNV